MQNHSHNTPTGRIGEQIAANYLSLKGHKIVERNYLKKYGEIDLITEYSGIIFFIEVKSELVSREIGETEDVYNPLDKVDKHKMNNLRKVIETYISENNVEKWQIDVIAVQMNSETKKANITHLKNVII